MPSSLLCRVSECLTKSDFRHLVHEADNKIYCMVANKRACFFTTIKVFEDRELLQFAISLERRCHPKILPRVAEACNHFNWMQTLGIFCVDFRDGEVLFHHGVDVEGILITPKFISNCVKLVLEGMTSRVKILYDLLCGATVELKKELRPRTDSNALFLELLAHLLATEMGSERASLVGPTRPTPASAAVPASAAPPRRAPSADMRDDRQIRRQVSNSIVVEPPPPRRDIVREPENAHKETRVGSSGSSCCILV
jgi:hypothetical protein